MGPPTMALIEGRKGQNSSWIKTQNAGLCGGTEAFFSVVVKTLEDNGGRPSIRTVDPWPTKHHDDGQGEGGVSVDGDTE